MRSRSSKLNSRTTNDSRRMTTKPVQDSIKLWSSLVSSAGLDLRNYDGQIISELCDRLNLHDLSKRTPKIHVPKKPITPNQFEAQLTTYKVSVERLLIAFLQSIQPFSMMLVDLLGFFERSGATHTNENLLIKFDFGKNVEELDFDLNNFRTQVEGWRDIERIAKSSNLTADIAWQLVRIFSTDEGQLHDSGKIPDRVNEWISQYKEDRSWPSGDPEVPAVPEELNEEFAKLSQLLHSVMATSSGLTASRDDLHERVLATIRNNIPQEKVLTGTSGESPVEGLWQLHSDYWPSAFLRNWWLWATNNPNAETVQRVQKELNQVFDEIGVSEHAFTERIRVVEDLLRMPVWKRRHELFSVWVGCEIVSAIELFSPTVHQCEGELRFQFSGTQLATWPRSSAKTQELWAELRSPLALPRGKGRTSAIQPDYSVSHRPITNPLTCDLVVECKQYLRSATKSFADAVVDYANGRPNARVILVNYGPIAKAVEPHVPKGLADRVFFIADLRPDRPDARRRFAELVRERLESGARDISDELISSATSDDSVGVFSRVTLEWSGQPEDLDLHCYVFDGESLVEHIFYGRTWSSDCRCGVKIDTDERDGGKETIAFQGTPSVDFVFAVYNFSNESPLNKSNAVVTYSLADGRTMRFSIPKQGEGRWWHVCMSKMWQESVSVVNEITDDEPRRFD